MRRRLFPRNPSHNSRPAVLNLEGHQRVTDANELARLRVETPNDP
jgi:hypothetical protein